MELYADFRNEYKFLDFSLSHSQLLLRSMRNNDRDYNIDILFKGVSIILLPTILRGIKISLFEISNTGGSIKKYGFETGDERKIFNIENVERKVYYINAYALGIFHNELEILETSIGRYDYNQPGEKILWYNG